MKYDVKVGTCAQPHKRVGLQQGRDEGLGVGRQGVVPLWPHDVVCQKQQRQRNVRNEEESNKLLLKPFERQR